MKLISPNKIESINILTGELVIKRYGNKGRYGVIEITSKKINKYSTYDWPTNRFPVAAKDSVIKRK